MEGEKRSLLIAEIMYAVKHFQKIIQKDWNKWWSAHSDIIEKQPLLIIWYSLLAPFLFNFTYYWVLGSLSRHVK